VLLCGGTRLNLSRFFDPELYFRHSLLPPGNRQNKLILALDSSSLSGYFPVSLAFRSSYAIPGL
jgi:hypothetical protein